MDSYLIEGGSPLSGTVSISGSKNAALPIMAATLLTDGKCVIENVPDLRDTRTMVTLLEHLGKVIQFEDNILTIDTNGKDEYIAPYEIVKTMRASIAVLGPLLAKKGKVKVSLPGGCAIGPRPVDLHIKAMELLGATIKLDEGYIDATADELIGNTLNLIGPNGVTVLGTANAMMAAVLAKGETLIDPAAMEPEIEDLGHFLVKMGAKIEGLGTSAIKIKGVKKLKGIHYKIIPDRIEAGTFLAMVGACGGEIKISDIKPSQIANIIEPALETGLKIEQGEDYIIVKKDEALAGIEVSTHPFPGFPTDMQPQFISMLSTAKGLSIVKENIFEDRFIHVGELQRMGASIRIDTGGTAIIKGKSFLKGAPVMASDLRAGAGLVIAGLAGHGTTEVQRIYHVERGYESFIDKINGIGGKIIKKKRN